MAVVSKARVIAPQDPVPDGFVHLSCVASNHNDRYWLVAQINKGKVDAVRVQFEGKDPRNSRVFVSQDQAKRALASRRRYVRKFGSMPPVSVQSASTVAPEPTAVTQELLESVRQLTALNRQLLAAAELCLEYMLQHSSPRSASPSEVLPPTD